MTDDLIGVNQNIANHLIKTTFWGVTERAARSSIKSRVEPQATAHAVTFWDHGFLLDTIFYHLLLGWSALGLAKR